MSRFRLAVPRLAIRNLAAAIALTGCFRQAEQITGSNLVPPEGALVIAIESPAEGLTPQVTITGPDGFRQTVTSSETFQGLVDGTYQVRADTVYVSGDQFDPAPEVQSVEISRSASARGRAAPIRYRRSTGALALQIDGLPAGVGAAVRIEGPQGFAQDVAVSSTLSGLRPGSYAVRTAERLVDGQVYAPTPSAFEVEVSAAAEPALARVAFAPTTGSLIVLVSGLTLGTPTTITVTGPGFSRQVVSGEVLKGLTPGEYSIQADAAVSGSTTFDATPALQRVDVTAGVAVERTVVFAARVLVTGSLGLTVSGVPNGSAAEVLVTGPGGFSRVVATTSAIHALLPGTYTITASALTSGGTAYLPAPSSQTASIAAGAMTARSVSYAAAPLVPGSLTLSVTGLPLGALATVTVTGPGTYRRIVNGSTSLTGLTPGDYSISAEPATLESATFQPTPAVQSVEVTAGSTVTRAVAYEAPAVITGSLGLAFSGVPTGAVGDVLVIGPGGFSRVVTATAAIHGLVPGLYTLSATAIVSGGTTYTASPSMQSAAVVAGAMTSKAVAYAAVPPTSGALTVTITGLPTEAAAAVTVTGPASYSRVVTATTTIAGLVPGNYVISSAAVAHSGTNYLPTPTTQTAAVTAGAAVDKAVSFAAAAPTTGMLLLTVAGLPNSVAGAVTVTGPASYTRVVTATTSIAALPAGTYTIASAPVTHLGVNYLPTPLSQTAVIAVGGTVEKSVSYAAAAPLTGTLVVTVTGLPTAAAGAVTVTGPASYSRLLTATTTITALPVGSYTIASVAVVQGGATYAPTPASQSATISAAATTSRAVTYAVPGAAQVTLTGTTRYQTIDGWATTLRMWEEDKINNRYDASVEQYSSATASYLANSVGINAVRVEILSGWENPVNDWSQFVSGAIGYTEFAAGRYEKINDNSSATVTNLAGFQFAALDYRIERSLLPLKAALEARGERLHINVNYLDFNWNGVAQGSLSHANNPTEFAEFVLVYFQHLRDKYGLIPDSFEMILEPENTQSWRGVTIGNGLVAVAAKLRANGFNPEFIAPSTTNMSNALPYFNTMLSVPGAAALVSTLAYHRYGGESEANAQALHTAAAGRGIKTAMLEKVDAGIDVLMEDLTVAHVSGWQQWAMAGRTTNVDNGGYYARVNVGQSGSGAITSARLTDQLAQVFRNVRRGAVRIGSQSTASNHVTAGFINPDGRWVAIIRAESSGGWVTINGLPPGVYTVGFSSDQGTTTAAQIVTVAGPFSLQIASAGVLSIRGVP